MKNMFSKPSILLIVFTVFYSNALHCAKKKHHHRVATTVSAKTANEATKRAQTTPATITALITQLATAQLQLKEANDSVTTNIPATITALRRLAATITVITDDTNKAYATAHKTSSLIKPIDCTQEAKIINSELAPLLKIKKRHRTSEQQAEIADYENQLTQVKQQAAAEQQAAQKAASHYVIFSNAVGARIKIYVAQKNNPSVVLKAPVAVIKKSQQTFKMLCNPGDIYYIKVQNQNGIINKKGKIVYHYRTLSRHGSKHDTFSDTDKGHQIIIGNYHQYSVHTMHYKGKGSLKQVKAQDIAGIVCLAVVAAVLLVVSCGAASFVIGGMMAADGITAAAATSMVVGEAVGGDVAMGAFVGGVAVGATAGAATGAGAAAEGVNVTATTQPIQQPINEPQQQNTADQSPVATSQSPQ